MGALHCVDRYLVPATGAANAWIMTLGTAFAVTVAYFGAAWLGLGLLAQPSDVAVFWPASGIAAGILIAAGRRAGVALVVGVLVGTVVANLMSDRSVLTSVLKGFCNVGEVVLMAFLLDRWFGRPFIFADLRRVVGFFAAAAFSRNLRRRRFVDHDHVSCSSAILGCLAHVVLLRCRRHRGCRAVLDRGQPAEARALIPSEVD
jgi:integral membrane sensor domain MASE1